MSTRLGRTAWWTLALAGAAGLLLSLVVGTGRDAPQVAEVRGGAAVSGGATTAEAAGSDRRAGPGQRASRPVVGRADAALASLAARRVDPPVRLSVPDVGLESTVLPVGVAGDGQMRLPADPRVLGWYRFGPAPGAGGSVVVAGHVDSREYGVGPLAALEGIDVGAWIELATGPGRVRSYRVDSIERFDRQALPAAVFARTGPERLRLVTCTGPYLPDAGGYQQNLVVTAVPA